MRTIEIARGASWPALKAAAGLAALDEATWNRHAPDLHLAIVDDDDAIVARCSCWWTSWSAGAPSGPPSRPPSDTSSGTHSGTSSAASSGALGGRPEEDAASDGAERLGVIGHYAAADADAGVRVLREACARLAMRGCTRAVGPMDGNTWRSYRLVIERAPGGGAVGAAGASAAAATASGDGAEPPFFLEPDTPDAWVAHFTAAGFTVLATYTSALARDLTRRDERLGALAARLRRGGVAIRPLDLSRADEELRRIHALSLVSFQDNVLYTPLDEAEFLDQNRRLLPVVQPDLVLLAERGEALVGFLFAVPDVLRARQSSPAGPSFAAPSSDPPSSDPPSSNPPSSNPLSSGARALDTIVIKTVAVLPGLSHAGLGSLLVAEVQQRAAARGYTRAIHALMHEQNVSRNISRRYAETIRRYALFETRLTRPIAIASASTSAGSGPSIGTSASSKRP